MARLPEVIDAVVLDGCPKRSFYWAAMLVGGASILVGDSGGVEQTVELDWLCPVLPLPSG